jgi:excisionase family DNA binding protein
MSHDEIVQKIKSIEKMLSEQTLLKKDVLVSKEAAVYLGLSLGYLYKLTGKNKIPVYKPNDGKLYFRRMDLNRWMLSKRKAIYSKSPEASGPANS